ncbi:MAG: tRNA (adenosine(37)-N6)-threonylcarbamoyltransferase complex transferase subunit TsaD [bacterium]
MRILAIETSCDDTSVALVDIKGSNFKILENIISSQIKIHKKWGGVVPNLARREHQKNLPIILKKVLSNKEKPDIVSVTKGPGLEPCLWVGINLARELAEKIKKPLIGINHIEAHVLVNFISEDSKIKINKKLFPAICLIVSGGHTQLVLMKGLGKYKIIGETRDDAAGECFDKIAKILGLGYPGGPIIDNKADQWRSKSIISKKNIKLPRPMMNQKNYDFSFSGLKTAVLYDFKSRSQKARKSESYIQEISSEAQQSIIDVLISKTIKAIKEFKVNSLILGGGVTASKELKKQFRDKIKKEFPKVEILIPSPSFSTDNALMVATAAFLHKDDKNKNWKTMKANANLKIDK